METKGRSVRDAGAALWIARDVKDAKYTYATGQNQGIVLTFGIEMGRQMDSDFLEKGVDPDPSWETSSTISRRRF